MKANQSKPDDWDSDIDGAWEDEEGSGKAAEGETLFIGSDMSDSQPVARQPVAPTRGRGRAATTKRAAAPKRAAPPKKAPARGRGKKVVESEEEEEEEVDDDDEDMDMDEMLLDEYMDVDEDEDEVVPVKTTAYVSSPSQNRHVLTIT